MPEGVNEVSTNSIEIYFVHISSHTCADHTETYFVQSSVAQM